MRSVDQAAVAGEVGNNDRRGCGGVRSDMKGYGSGIALCQQCKLIVMPGIC